MEVLTTAEADGCQIPQGEYSPLTFQGGGPVEGIQQEGPLQVRCECAVTAIDTGGVVCHPGHLIGNEPEQGAVFGSG